MRESAAAAPVPTNSGRRKAALATSAEPVSLCVQHQREAALAAYTAALLSK